MNIFVTDPCPRKSAEYLDSKRVVKMILESAQMLSTALIEHNIESVYKPTHINHPCSIWTRQTRANYKWLLEHFTALCSEYTLRYGKVHKCQQYLNHFSLKMCLIPEGPQTPFANCARNKTLGIDYTSYENVYTAYQLYLNDRWDTDKRQPTWR